MSCCSSQLAKGPHFFTFRCKNPTLTFQDFFLASPVTRVQDYIRTLYVKVVLSEGI